MERVNYIDDDREDIRCNWSICKIRRQKWVGSYNLGNGIYMIPWDRGNIIVDGTTFGSRACVGGIEIIPRNGVGCLPESAYSIVDAKYNDRWIITNTVDKDNKKNYFIID